MTFLPNAFCAVCRERVRAVLGRRQPDVATVGVWPYIYACALYDPRRLHRHQGRAAWLPDGKIHMTPDAYDRGWPQEHNRVRTEEEIADRKRRALAWTRRPPESYVRPPKPAYAPRTAQRRFV